MKIKLSQRLDWEHQQVPNSSLWYSEAGIAPNQQVLVADDSFSANTLYQLAKDGHAILWQGDYQNARQALTAVARRVDRPQRVGSVKKPTTPAEIFHQHREEQRKRATILGQILIPISSTFEIKLRRGQDVKEALALVLETPSEDFVMSLRGLLAINSAYEWQKKGILIPFLQQKIIPCFGVFSPARSEYIDLVAQQPLPSPCNLAFDIGVGSGVLSAILAKRGIKNIISTDIDPRAIDCATKNIHHLGYAAQVEVIQQPLFPAMQANLIVCNPPWVPALPSSPIENAVFDPDSSFLKSFLLEVVDHLTEQGRAWLILSDLAEHLGLRSRDQLLNWIQEGGLQVVNKVDVSPKHPKTRNNDDPLFFARSKEVTSLWEFAKV
ncbi:50S ribosomal protein L11 methyltransferase [Polynucleobacter kasalickyi]|uniref:Ribosomal protein L11 methyltransferase (PrmA) n=1 Tax=Polynucleobacter kasalickyi TaxID=1938817 RepID=A0A1W2BAR3_9BURK|nr:class I SAM-dependent methyltransferase [Polynucleobacter kasalickyi]SMC70055.1 Ribosomal protein L11 methyltransferase (PrmA) [Polynucleobacter kasalickyi]